MTAIKNIAIIAHVDHGKTTLVDKILHHCNLFRKPLASGGKFTFQIDWWYNINDRLAIGGRSGYEHFEEEDNYLYTIAQFFPRLCAYYDRMGWQNKQFLGSGEFTLEFGDYDVSITVPSDHIVGSTGVLQNPKEVLTATQRARFEEAKTADRPVLIVTEEEARENEKTKEKGNISIRWDGIAGNGLGSGMSRMCICTQMPLMRELG